MALDTASLKKELAEIFGRSNSAEDAASAIAEALEKWVRTADVTVTAATGAIAVVGSPTAQANPAPIPITGSPTSMTGGIT